MSSQASDVNSPSGQSSSSGLSAPIAVYVVCRSRETAAHWQKRAALLDGLDIITEVGCTSYYDLIARIIGEGHTQPVLLAHDDIWLGLGFADAVRELLDELNRDFACWGVCGNAGISWDGHQVHRYITDPHGGPQYGLVPDFVLGIDGNLMLLNVPALASAGVTMPPIKGFHGYDISLSWESLRRGLPVLCDRRLFVKHNSGGDNDAFQKFVRQKPFQSYLARNFLNHSLPTLNDRIDTSLSQSYQYLDIPGNQEGRQQDLIELYDRALAAGRTRRPSLTIGCRSQFNRPELLTRAVASFAVAAQQAPELVEIKVRIVSDKPAAQMNAELERLQRLFPGLDLDAVSVSRTPERYSRTEALIAAVNQAQTDYIWFVDDDDFVYPDTIRSLARAMAPCAPRVVVGHSLRIEETWADNGKGTRQIKESRQVGRYEAEGVYHAFGGDNHTPVCSLIFPVEALRERLAEVAARGDYYEDYFLLLLTLTAPRIEVRLVHADICGISLREGENTVTEPCRDHWDLSYTTFMSEILRHPRSANPLLWQLAERRFVQSPPAPALTPLPQARPLWRRVANKVRRPAEAMVLLRRFRQFWRINGFRAAIRRSLHYLFPR